MAGTETAGQFPKSPLDKLGHTLHERFVGVGHAVQKHPFRIALAGVFVALGLEALHFQQYFGPPPVDNALISDTLKPPEGEQGVGIVITPTQEPKPTAESLKPTPTPEPTSTPELTPQQRIELVRQIQQEALESGKIKIPVPEQIVSNGGQIKQSPELPNGAKGLYFTMSENKSVIFPALIPGEVIDADRSNKFTNLVIIKRGDLNFWFLFPSTGRLIVNKGEVVTLGQPLFEVSFDSSSEIQNGFENQGFQNSPKGTIVLFGIQDATAGPGKGYKQITLNNIMNETIPTLTSNK